MPRPPTGELASAPDHGLRAIGRSHGCPTFASAEPGAGGSTAPSWPSSTPWPWLPPFVAPLTFPSARHDFGRLCRTSAARQPSRPTAHVDHMRTTSIPSNHGAFTNQLHIKAWSSHVDPAHERHSAAPLRTIAFVPGPPDGLRSLRRRLDRVARRRRTSASPRSRSYGRRRARCRARRKRSRRRRDR
jgi:hypothetical protein